jgi:AraC-like DNA-binding protein
MSRAIPLVRASALAPVLLWMRARGLDPEARLRDAGLPTTLLDEPERPIALLAGIRFFAALAEREGPDFGCRVVCDASVAQLASFGRVALGARTPREALKRMMRAYPHHSSHEQFVVLPEPGGLTVRHWFLVGIDDAALHVCHQYVAAMIRAVTANCGIAGPRLSGVRLVPHPRAGLDHLRGYLDGTPRPATDGTLTVSLTDAVLDRPYRRPTRDRGPSRLSPIRGDGTLAASLRLILPGILQDRPARVAELAELAGASPRTFQRRLAAERTSLSQIVDGLRRERALDRLAHGRDPVGSISADLGYSDQSSLTRAMRRWSDAPPTRVRQAGGSARARD